jgi:hypothetical protein
MRIKITSPVWVSGTPRAIGEELDLDKGDAVQLIRAKKAQAIEEVKPENREKELTAKRKTR